MKLHQSKQGQHLAPPSLLLERLEQHNEADSETEHSDDELEYHTNDVRSQGGSATAKEQATIQSGDSHARQQRGPSVQGHDRSTIAGFELCLSKSCRPACEPVSHV